MTAKKILPFLYAIFVLVFIHYYPKMIIAEFGLESPWTSYLYMYGLGFIVFITGIWVILGSGALIFGRGRDTYWFKVLVGGFVFFAATHFFWILAAIKIPYLGGL